MPICRWWAVWNARSNRLRKNIAGAAIGFLALASRNGWRRGVLVVATVGIVPGIRRPTPMYLGPESGWTDLLCRRIREFLKQFPWVLDPRWTLVADEQRHLHNLFA